KRNIARSTLTLGKADGGGYLLTPDKSNFGPQEEMICYDMQFDDDGERVVFECLALTDDAMAGALKNMKTHDITFKAIQELFSENGRSVMPSEISVWREENEVPIGKGTVRN